MYRKLHILLLLICTLLPTVVFGDEIDSNHEESELSFFVLSDPINDYNAWGCGDSMNSPCNSIQDAIYSFLNKTITPSESEPEDSTPSSSESSLSSSSYSSSSQSSSNSFPSMKRKNRALPKSTPFILNLFGENHFESHNIIHLDNLNIKIQAYQDHVTIKGHTSYVNPKPSFSISSTGLIFIKFDKIIFSDYVYNIIGVYGSSLSVAFENCIFQDNNFNGSGQTGGPISYSSQIESQEHKHFSFSNCIYKNQKGYNGFFQLYNATVFIYNSSFIDNENFGFFLKDSHLTILYSIFTNNIINNQELNEVHGLIHCDNCRATIDNSNFYNNYVRNSLLYIINGSVDFGQTIFMNNTKSGYLDIPEALVVFKDVNSRIHKSAFVINLSNNRIIYARGGKTNLESTGLVENESTGDTLIFIQDGQFFFRSTEIQIDSDTKANSVFMVVRSRVTMDNMKIKVYSNHSTMKTSIIECFRSELYFISSTIENYGDIQSLLCDSETDCLSLNNGNSTFSTYYGGKMESTHSISCRNEVQDENQDDDDIQLDDGTIAAIVVCIFAFVIISVMSIIFFIKRNSSNQNKKYTKQIDDIDTN
ncbi:hypothetical protein CYY_000335 [Polysphondylium violaceum]|uniref:Right handed beta helix domain-containing protein n=1 Tax=Polysphondylium violaceum TaxID=133409 RepID=A0A8J4Q1Z7_9MYCE|nr:hypothetical protein CYY_000335 [Polysphondylium violaceum]